MLLTGERLAFRYLTRWRATRPPQAMWTPVARGRSIELNPCRGEIKILTAAVPSGAPRYVRLISEPLSS
jgi:hypothetical protein